MEGDWPLGCDATRRASWVQQLKAPCDRMYTYAQSTYLKAYIAIFHHVLRVRYVHNVDGSPIPYRASRGIDY